MKSLEKFFNPRSIAVIGASPKKGKLGNILIKNISAGSWRGKVFGVNPKYGKIGKIKCYKSLGEIKKPVDLALVAIPAPFITQVLAEGARARPKIENYVVISAGFKEAGKAGQKLEEGLINVAKKHQLNVLGPNCLGFINIPRGLNATFTDARVGKGKIAVISQSGALEVALLDWAEEHKAGFSKVISIGNKAVVGENEILRYLDGDRETGAIAVYLEDIKGGADFIAAVSRINCRKPLAVIKAGKSRAGQKAIASHTGSLAQDEKVTKAVFAKFGIISAGSVEELQDIISYLEYNKIPANREVVVITNAGGLGVLSADFIGSSTDLNLRELPKKTKKALGKILPDGASAENPIDILGDAPPERYRATLGAVAKDFGNSPVLVLLTPQSQTEPLKVAKILGSFRKKFPSLSASFVGGTKIKKALAELEKRKIPNFESPERALTAIGKTARQKSCRRDIFSAALRKPVRLKLKTNRILAKARSEKRKMLFWEEAGAIFAEYGIPVAQSQTASGPKDVDFKKIKFPCVLKTDDPKIIHRWDRKAVALDIKNRKELAESFERLKKATRAGNFVVQPMFESGLEMIVGMKRDQSFGPVIVAGLGGTLTELFKDSVVLVPPLTAAEIKSELKRLKTSQIMAGFRGEKGYDAGEIARIVLAIQQIASENPDIRQIDVNPLILYNNGSPYRLPDVKIYL